MFDPTSWDAPFAVVVATLFVIVMLRGNATYLLGRGIAAGARRTRAAKLMESKHYATGAKWLNRWGAPAVAFCFLTVGLQTMVLLAAGITRMPLRRYLPAVIIGCIMWAFLYGTVGMIGFKAIGLLWAQSPWLVLALALLAAGLIFWMVRRRDEAVPTASH
ncbi:MAG: VTT domain-containing protein [Propionibacteriaceae bacterium]|nr:VTT domain-containing protein [Propionibacteriaceae bacterium]